MRQRRTVFGAGCLTVLVIALSAVVAQGATVQELVRIKGHEENVLTGLGLVVGLNGTGDTSKESLIAARPYARLLENLGNPVGNVEELVEADAYAIVLVTLRVPATGAREGDRLDVSVNKLFNAESLEGGRLVVSLLRLPAPDSADLAPMAFAEGDLLVEGDNPGRAKVRDGGQMLQNIRMRPVAADGTITLVLEPEYASWPVATTIANAIDDEFAIDGLTNLTVVEDAKNIRVQLPEADRRHPAQFITTLLMIPIDSSLLRRQARIVINETAGIITATGDVEIGPVAITHAGLQLNVTAPADPNAPATPGTRRWVGMDTTEPTGRRSTRLTDLLAAFEQLSVSTKDQIAIIYELKRTGALYAEVITE